jgi:hypothetical protein
VRVMIGTVLTMLTLTSAPAFARVASFTPTAATCAQVRLELRREIDRVRDLHELGRKSADDVIAVYQKAIHDPRLAQCEQRGY